MLYIDPLTSVCLTVLILYTTLGLLRGTYCNYIDSTVLTVLSAYYDIASNSSNEYRFRETEGNTCPSDQRRIQCMTHNR